MNPKRDQGQLLIKTLAFPNVARGENGFKDITNAIYTKVREEANCRLEEQETENF